MYDGTKDPLIAQDVFDEAPELQAGHIVSALPGANLYRFYSGWLSSPIEVFWSDTAGASLGPNREGTGLNPGDRVLARVPMDAGGVCYDAVGEILYALPSHTFNTGEDTLIAFEPRSLSTKLYPAQSHYIRSTLGGTYSLGTGMHGGTREDIIAGEWGKGNSAGGLVRLGMLDATLKACEQAGVEAHVVRRMLKLIGFNMKTMTGGGIDYRISDDELYSEIRASVPYLVDAQGGALTEKGTETTGLTYPRSLHLGGFLGGAETDIVQLPQPVGFSSPEDGSATATAQDGMRVLTEQKTWDGAYYLDASGEIVVGKVGPGQPVRLGDFVSNTIEGGPQSREISSRIYVGDTNTEYDGYDYIYVDDNQVLGNPAGFGCLEQGQARRTERLSTILSGRLLSSGETPSMTTSQYMDFEGVDDRGDARLYDPGELESYWKWTDNGTFVLEVNSKNAEAETQKLVIGHGTSEFYGDLAVIGDAHVGLMADVVDIVGFDGAHIYSEGDILIQSGSATVVKDMVRGQWQPDRIAFDPDARVLKWDGTEWVVIGEYANVSSPFTTDFSYLQVEHCATEAARYLELTGGDITTGDVRVKVQIGEFDGTGPDGYIEDFPDDPISLPENVGTGTVITIDGADNCYRVVGMVEDVPGGSSSESSAELDITITSENCVQCLDCWELTNCNDETDTVIVNGTLSDGTSLADYTSSVVKYKGDCYHLARASDPTACTGMGSRVIDADDISADNNSYSSCEACYGDCWKLTPCGVTGSVRYVRNIIDSGGGHVVVAGGMAVEVGGICYSVSSHSGTECQNADTDVTATNVVKWELTNCVDANDVIYASELIDGAGAEVDSSSGDVVRTATKCYTVAALSGDAGCDACEASVGDVTVEQAAEWKLVPCSGTGDTIYVSSAENEDAETEDISGYAVVRLSSQVCYTVAAVTDPCAACAAGEQAVTVLEAYDNCNACVYYKLTHCDTGAIIYTYVDLAGLGYSVGNVISLDTGDCYEITSSTDDLGGETPQDITVEESWTSCAQCRNVTLVNDCMPSDCGTGSGADDLVVHDDDTLIDNIGKVVQVGDVCYTITKGGVEPADGYDTPSYTILATCQDCLDALEDQVRGQMLLTGIRIEGTSIVVERVTQLVQGNKIVGYCEEDDIVLTGTECVPTPTPTPTEP